jgi:outer membrane immunogenic protein
MKKLALSVAALALTAGGALAADLPSRKGPPVLPPPPPPPPMWTGFYAGLNAGYNFGTNSNISTISVGDDATMLGGIINPAGAGNISLYNVAIPAGAGLAMSGSQTHVQDGFIGGGQIGYNYQWGSNFVIGIEADIQGSGIRGTSRTAGAGGATSFSPLYLFQPGGVGTPFVDPLPGFGLLNTSNAIGGTSVNAGVDWLGTVRGRLGYLWTPTMLVYATGGLTYGGVYANVNQWATTSLNTSLALGPIGGFGPLGTNHSFVGGGSKSETLVGWNVGGGLEWMFMPNWSLKAEAIYWNMGNMDVATSSGAPAPLNVAGIAAVLPPIPALAPLGALSAVNSLATVGATRVNYQGVIARAGVNYHFNWGGAAPIVAKY